jgi:dephospho-CoA kinase
MLRVGLTGGIATGKSTVAKMFADLGCHVLDSDAITRELFQPGHAVNALVGKAFGASVVAADGGIDRTKLADLVFKDEGLRQRLNGIVHPAIIERQKEFLEVVAGKDPEGIGMVEAALMVEVGTYRNYDKLIVVVSTPAIQRRRLRERSGLTAEQIRSRIAAQMPLEEKAKFADFIVETSKGLDKTRQQVEEIHRELRALALTRSGESHKRD